MSAAAVTEAMNKMSDTNVDKTKMYVDMKQSQSYADHRPQYSEEMYKVLTDYVRETLPGLNTAVDVGCGPGCSTRGLAKYFKKVIGVDVSPTQIACAPKDIPNVEFKVGYSDKLPFVKDNSIDLFCSGESFNLMPHAETFAEADRVLKPGGTIAIFGYVMPRCKFPEVNNVLMEWWIKMLPFWPKASQEIFEKFINLEMPYPNSTRRDDLTLSFKTDHAGWEGLVESAFPAMRLRKEFPDDPFLEENSKKLKQALLKANNNGKTDFEIIYDLFILMAHKPKN